MVDYLVVGLGLAAVSFCEVLHRNGKTFHIINDDSQTSSKVAGGLYNPVILKRFTLAFNAKEQLDKAMPFYTALEKRFNIKLNYKTPILRLFASIEEQNIWLESADKLQLQPFLSTTIRANSNENIEAPFGYGEVKQTGRIDVKLLLREYTKFLLYQSLLDVETFNFSHLVLRKNHISYKSIKAKHIVFATGFGMKYNPYFNYLPLNGTKGELITIKAPKLKETKIVKSSVFIIPLGGDLFSIGSTYKWKDKTNTPTEEAKTDLLEKLDKFLKCDYTVVNHVAGIRPTVVDRRPLLGRHPKHINMYVLNGFGSRGVMIAPTAAFELFNFIENNSSLSAEIDISRFTTKYFK